MNGTLESLPPFGLSAIWKVLTTFDQGPWVVATLVVEVLALGWYGRSVMLLKKRGHRWSRGRTASAVGAFAAFLLAFQSGIPVYAGSIFTVHVIQHLDLMIGAPILLALSAPVTLAMQTLDKSKKTTILKILKSKPFRFVANPVVAIVGNNGIMFWFFLGRGIDWAMPRPMAMDFVNCVFLVFGALAWWPIVSPDYIGRRRYAHPIRVLLGVSGMPFDAFLAIALLPGGATVSIAPKMYSLGSVQAGAAVFWIAIMMLSGLGLVIPLVQWMKSERRKDVRGDQMIESSKQVKATSSKGWWDETTEIDKDGFMTVPWSK